MNHYIGDTIRTTVGSDNGSFQSVISLHTTTGAGAWLCCLASKGVRLPLSVQLLYVRIPYSGDLQRRDFQSSAAKLFFKMITKSFTMAVMLTALFSVVASPAEAIPHTRQRSNSPRASANRKKKHKPTRDGSTPRVGRGLQPLPRNPPDRSPMSDTIRNNPAMTRGGLRLPPNRTVSNETQTSNLPHASRSGDGSPIGAEGAGPSRMRIPVLPVPDVLYTPAQNPVPATVLHDIPQFGEENYRCPELLREATWVREPYRAAGLYIPPNLPKFTDGMQYITEHEFVFKSDAEIFALYLEENVAAIDELMYSDRYSPGDKQPVNCPPGCRIQTYPLGMQKIMRELHTKHDNLVSTFTAYMARSRSEVLVPAQLAPFLHAHFTPDVSNENQHKFVFEVLCECFNYDINELAYCKGTTPLE